MDAVRRSLNNGNSFKITISIQNLKDQIEGEDHRESDGSEEKPAAQRRRQNQSSLVNTYVKTE